MPRLGASSPVLLALLAIAAALPAQHPLRHPVDAIEVRYARSQPVVAYLLRVDPSDLSILAVEMRIRNAPDTFRLAMAAHPEYDDRFWRFVEGMRVDGPAGPGTIAREDSALWRVVARGGASVVHYRIRLPPPAGRQRPAWRPFLTPSGGLVGGPHTCMYVLGETLAPSHVTLDLPAGWEAATGLEPTSDAHTFFAASAELLIDSPILVGRLRNWRFTVDGVPHRVAYWPLPDAVPFDTTAFVGAIERLARQAIALFGRAPYREYTFLLQDGAYGALEHLNSVTLGASSAELTRDQSGLLEEVAHEYFHSWNLMRIRPAERDGIDYRPAKPSRGMWWSEGLSMFYADLLLRRADVPITDTTRITHLEGLIARYLSSPGNARIAPERASLTAYGSSPNAGCPPVLPGGGCDYDASVHLQGELLGAMLDLRVREATNDRRSLDDIMRAMMDRFSGEHGFAGRDIERTISDICACDVRSFFADHVRGAHALDFDRYLRTIGMRALIAWRPALDDSGRRAPDRRIWAWLPAGETALRFVVSDPMSVWGKAGLHTGDRIATVNDSPLHTLSDFRTLLGRLRIGDTVRVVVSRAGGLWRTNVAVTGYDEPVAKIEALADATERERARRTRWMAGTP